MVGEFTKVDEAMVAVVHVMDIISNALDGLYLAYELSSTSYK